MLLQVRDGTQLRFLEAFNVVFKLGAYKSISLNSGKDVFLTQNPLRNLQSGLKFVLELV